MSVDYATADGTATNGLKYTAVSGTLAFAVGRTNQTITVPILNEGLVEGTRTFTVTLSNPTNQVLGSQKTATVRITDNDPGVQFQPFNRYWIGENEGALVLTVVRGNDGSLGPFTVDFATSDLTATNGLDYVGTNGTLHFAQGEMAKRIMVPILNDEVPEPDKQFEVTLSNPSGGAVLGPYPTTLMVDRMPYFVGYALPDAPCATNLAPYPIVIGSTMGYGLRSSWAEKAAHLASHGYVVAVPDHVDTPGTVFPDGTCLIASDYPGLTTAVLQDRVSDLAFVLDELTRWNTSDALFAGRLDVAKVAALGGCCGYVAAAKFCRNDPRCTAAILVSCSVNVWPCAAPDTADLDQFGVQKPFLGVYGEACGNGYLTRPPRTRSRSRCGEPTRLIRPWGVWCW